MKDFVIKPDTKSEYGLFLVRNISNFNLFFISSIFEQIYKKNILISFERLFKGGEGALSIFGPKSIISKYKDLNLLELEDYARLDLNHTSIFEVNLRVTKGLKESLPKLLNDERIWIQLVAKGDKGFSSQIRVIIYSVDRLKQLTEEFHTHFKEKIVKLPKPYSKEQLFEFYKSRSFIKGDTQKIKAEDVLNLSLFL